MKMRAAQSQSMRHGFAFQTRLAGILEMPGREYAELIREIESDPVFIRLRSPDDKGVRLMVRRLVPLLRISARAGIKG